MRLGRPWDETIIWQYMSTLDINALGLDSKPIYSQGRLNWNDTEQRRLALGGWK